MIAIIDYGMGNVRSVFNALNYIGEEPVITADPKLISESSHLVLPGVGAFGDAVSNLVERNLVDILDCEVNKKGKPLLGICLGLQMLAKSSTEHGNNYGLGWFDAEVVKFPKDYGIKIPHMGWNEIILEIEHPVFANLSKGKLDFYFVHSYYVICNQVKNIAASCNYGINFTAAIYRDNIIATQFHPEKSHDNGIQLLENFVNWRP